MAYIAETPVFDENVKQIEIGEPVGGGVGGPVNISLKSLANRTQYLKKMAEELLADLMIVQDQVGSEKLSDALKKANNLADVADKAKARQNISAAPIEHDHDTRYLQIENSLSDVRSAESSRRNIGAMAADDRGAENGVAPLVSGKVPIKHHAVPSGTTNKKGNVIVDEYGHVMTVSEDLNAQNLTSGLMPIERHPVSGVTAGTYQQVQVNKYGHVIAGSAGNGGMVPAYAQRSSRALSTTYTAPSNGFLHAAVAYGQIYINGAAQLNVDFCSKHEHDTYLFPLKKGDSFQVTSNWSIFVYFIPAI